MKCPGDPTGAWLRRHREVIHPAAFTYKLPDHVSFAEGAMVEPFAIGMQAAARARIKPGDVALVTGAGPIGIMVALAALAGGCSEVYISDLVDESSGNCSAIRQYPSDQCDQILCFRSDWRWYRGLGRRCGL